ncbi:MAG: pilus assembly protein PilM, partial [Planctomycetota bacterium]
NFDVDNPPPSTVLLSIGTDSSDLIVTNGYRIWQRSMPIGGNHFTRQLTKDLKLTFAKAEHLKRNIREAPDPKLIIQTMRPVFNDLETEVQRSIGFFRSIDKKAEIDSLVVTGNTIKLPGLAAYLGKQLGYEVKVVDSFERLGGEDVQAIPKFKDNAATFAVCYGLCLQGLNQSQVHTSLVPQEILTERLIRSKKPWTVGALAALLLGMTGHYVMTHNSWKTAHDERWDSAKATVTSMKTYSTDQISEDEELNAKLTYLNELGKEISGDAERRRRWLEILRAVNAAIPRLDGEDAEKLPYEERKDFHITTVETSQYLNLMTWFDDERAERWREEYRNYAEVKNIALDDIQQTELDSDKGPDGPGWVIQLTGFHYYNSPKNRGLDESNHIRLYLIDSLLNGKVSLPVGEDANGEPRYEDFSFEEVGLTYPLLLDDIKSRPVTVPNPEYDDDNPDPNIPFDVQANRQDFVIQIVWIQNTLEERLAKREEEKALEAANQVAVN